MPIINIVTNNQTNIHTISCWTMIMMFVRVKLGAYADPGDASAENKALYGDTTDLERSGSASHDDHHYEEVPTTDGSEMSEIALNSSTSIENENYENGN